MPAKSKPAHLAAAPPPPPSDRAAFDAAVAAEVARQLAERDAVPARIVLPDALERNRLVGAKPAAEMLGYSLAHFRRLYRAGKIPAPVKINGRKVAWPTSVLLNFVAPHQTAA